MLVTVIRSYSPAPVTLPDGLVLKPWKFVEYTSLPDSMRPEPGPDGEKSELQKLVDDGIVKVSQIQDIGHLMTEGTDENSLPKSVTGQYVAAAGAPTPEQERAVAERGREFPDYVTENSKSGLMTEREAQVRAARGEDPDDRQVA